jgi:hypothetical protein
VCTECRASGVGGAGGVSGISQAAFNQLFQTVKKLCETVQNLAVQVSGVDQSRPNTTGDGLNVTGEGMRVTIREEVREMDERNKRRDSIIIRGLDAENQLEVKQKFNIISSHLLGTAPDLSNIVCIDRTKKLYRGKIVDGEARKKLLDSARNLKDSEFRGIFINRDLTFKQRKELHQRREERARAEASGVAVMLHHLLL